MYMHACIHMYMYNIMYMFIYVIFNMPEIISGENTAYIILVVEKKGGRGKGESACNPIASCLNFR